eukprot:6174605-Pleurochrysis_carterae.AAC.2
MPCVPPCNARPKRALRYNFGFNCRVGACNRESCCNQQESHAQCCSIAVALYPLNEVARTLKCREQFNHSNYGWCRG